MVQKCLEQVLKFIGDMYFLMPPIYEQKEIVEVIEAKLRIFEMLTDNSKNAIELMQERRTALISAAVTGKIDVRSWQSQSLFTAIKNSTRKPSA